MDEIYDDFDNDFDGEFDDIPANDFCDDTIKETNVPCGPLDAEDWLIIGPMSEEEAWRIWEQKRIEQEMFRDNYRDFETK